MQSSIAIIAFALAASASASYSPMQTTVDNVNSCICQGSYNKGGKYWSLTVADCASEAHTFPAFNFAAQDGYVKTADNLCLAPTAAGTVVLTKCKPATCNGWNYLQGNYWSNTNNCMAYNATLNTMVHVDCAAATPFVLDSCKVPAAAAPTAPAAAPVAPVPAPVPSTPLTCANFATACPAGYYVPSNYYNMPASSQTCVNTCCVAKPPATCYDYAVQAGYPAVNPCGVYGQFNPRAQAQTCSGQRNFINSCCIMPTPPVNTQTCYQWAGATAPGMATINACGADNLFMNGNAPCAADGSNCQAKCCMPLIYPTTTTANPQPTLY